MSRALSAAELEQRRHAALKSGAYSPSQIAAKARAHRRRFLRHAGLKVSDLDPVSRGYLDLWARGMAQLDLFDAAGQDRPREYWAAFNSTKRALDRLNPLLAGASRRNGDAGAELRAHLERNYAT